MLSLYVMCLYVVQHIYVIFSSFYYIYIKSKRRFQYIVN